MAFEANRFEQGKGNLSIQFNRPAQKANEGAYRRLF